MRCINALGKAALLSALALLPGFHADTNAAPAGKRAKVFLLAGQSNMNGYGSDEKQIPPPYAASAANVRIWNATEKAWAEFPLLNAKWGPAKQEAAPFGPELSFGHEIANAFPRDDIYLIKYATNGTALYNDWEPTKGPQYLAFRETAQAALGALAGNRVAFDIAGMLWLQGESDANEKQGQAYERNLAGFIQQVRTDFESPRMPFVIARVRDYYGKGEQADLVRAAQQSVAEKVDAVACFDTDDCGKLVRSGHYDSAGLIEIGRRFAEKMAQAGKQAGKKPKKR